MRIKLEANQKAINVSIQEFLEEKRLTASPKTIVSYTGHFQSLNKFIDFEQELTKSVCLELYKKIAESDLSPASKNSYMRTWRAFINYIDNTLPSPKMNKVESIKKTYTDEEIKILTTPPKNPNFTEFRDFVMTLVLADTGIRASSLRNIKPSDVQEDNIVLRHNKTGKVQIVPFSSYTAKYLHKYAKFMNDYEYLFTNHTGGKLTENALTKAIWTYNRNRGVELTSIHAWRHTFARNFIKNKGNLFALQKILGHSTLNTTHIYARIYDTDVSEFYISPVETLHRQHIAFK